MASLAGMLQRRGFRVTGSDTAAYPPMSDFLASLDIPVAPFAVQNLQPQPDVVVVDHGHPDLLDGGKVFVEAASLVSLAAVVVRYRLRGRGLRA